MKREEILDFCGRWLPAWEGNKPDELIQFYADDVLYLDPANKKGLRGRGQIFPYLKKLLAANPDWKWEPIECFQQILASSQSGKPQSQSDQN